MLYESTMRQRSDAREIQHIYELALPGMQAQRAHRRAGDVLYTELDSLRKKTASERNSVPESVISEPDLLLLCDNRPCTISGVACLLGNDPQVTK